MESCRSSNQKIPFADAKQASWQLQADLARHNADSVPDLNRMQIRFRDLARYAYEQTESEFRRLNSNRQLQFPRAVGDIGPTVLANLNIAHEEAIATRYGMNGELFWPEIEKFAAADANFKPGLEEAKVRLDFAVSMAAVAVLLTVGWLIGLLVAHAGRLPICLVAILGPAVAIIFHEIAVWNAHAFNSTVRTAIELFRFQVLTALHCELPADANAERALWSELTRLAELGQGTVTYHHA